MTDARNRRILLARRPEGALEPDDFAVDDGALPVAGAGQALCRTLLLSIDPAARAWMSGPTYRDQLQPGEVVPGYTLSEVVASDSAELPPGSLVAAEGGWQEYAVLDITRLRRVERRTSLVNQMSVLGITGLTAYFGLVSVGRPVAGQTVVVSAAAGATGNVVGQLARTLGCRVVGVCGTEAKATFLRTELGFDEVVDHHVSDVRAALASACPDGIDIYFDNVAGPVLTAVLPLMNLHGVIVSCGSVSGYDSQESVSLRALPGLIVTRRLRMEGFLVHDYEEEWDTAESYLAAELEAGRLQAVHDVFDGLESAPSALIDLLAGGNVGKRLVQVATETIRETSE